MVSNAYRKKLQPLPWYGGKAGFGKAEWIVGLLPWSKDSVYVEPFGGMAGVLLRRNPVRCEVFNDLDNRVVNWWKVVRDKPSELAWKIQMMPHSRVERERAYDVVDDDDQDDVDRALAFYVMATQTPAQNMNRKRTWRLTLDSKNGATGRWGADRVMDLADRLWDVQLECRPATQLLERLTEEEHAVLYCDPPYLSADTSAYSVCDLDIDALTALFLVQRGKVAISGFPGEWDHLGWERYELATVNRANPNGDRQNRVECLWINYDPNDGENIGGLFAGLEG